jgi:hypothetical protein
LDLVVQPSTEGLPMLNKSNWLFGGVLLMLIVSPSPVLTSVAAEEPVLEAIKVFVNTTEDDKDKEEEFIFTLSYKNKVVVEERRGKNVVWPNGDKRDFTFNLNSATPVPASELTNLKFRVEKTRFGSQQGCGWEGNIYVHGILKNGDQYWFIKQTDDFKLGEKGNPHVKDDFTILKP